MLTPIRKSSTAKAPGTPRSDWFIRGSKPELIILGGLGVMAVNGFSRVRAKWRWTGLMILAIICLVACAPQSTDIAASPAGRPPSAQDDSTPSPQVPNGFLFRPIFKTTRGTVRAGTAFAVQLSPSDRPIIVSALHLLGPSGGLAADIAARDVPIAVTKVSLVDCFDDAREIEVNGKPIAIPDAAPLGTRSEAGDIIAFWTSPDPRLAPRPLAMNVPAKDAPVWLAARLVRGAPPTKRLHRAAVIGMGKDGDVYYTFEDPGVSLRATSGAPVLNGAGEVVAINLGGSTMNKQLIGVGNPVDRFRRFLVAAAKGNE